MSLPWSETRLREALASASEPSSDYDLDPGITPPDTPLRAAGVLAAFHADEGKFLALRKPWSSIAGPVAEIPRPWAYAKVSNNRSKKLGKNWNS